MTTPTPGPWAVLTGVCRTDYPDSSADVTGTNEHSDVVIANCGCHEAAIANARLIAMAPDLLMALRGSWHLCQSILAVRDGVPDEALAAFADGLQLIIAKAEGTA